MKPCGALFEFPEPGDLDVAYVGGQAGTVFIERPTRSGGSPHGLTICGQPPWTWETQQT